ncbi:integration host factor subunit beta [Salinisphaera japonica]|uniref:Integration host factor subunit beta n=1 Tax=Salinisphaera japonica YTM-1 TaxID=1209778 RepID=A0A423PSL6_9GAMM|nr:integration host factor subunit beta [Salinisphaera japonica]ROO28599.1 transcriptional regulator [Salinisphaera japonica YTM-1]|tara:strand:+ start:195 stop:485 length:291 start_codon:yes stop_codon:yes gene_type:complete
MTKSELIERLVDQYDDLTQRDVELAVRLLLDRMIDHMAEGGRVEIRGFGSFSVHHRPARHGRNPKTGESVEIPPKYVSHFKPGKELRERVNLAVAD